MKNSILNVLRHLSHHENANKLTLEKTMDRPVIIIDAPDLNDNAVKSMQIFLHELIMAFESHYYHQLKQQDMEWRTETSVPLTDDQVPF